MGFINAIPLLLAACASPWRVRIFGLKPPLQNSSSKHRHEALCPRLTSPASSRPLLLQLPSQPSSVRGKKEYQTQLEKIQAMRPSKRKKKSKNRRGKSASPRQRLSTMQWGKGCIQQVSSVPPRHYFNPITAVFLVRNSNRKKKTLQRQRLALRRTNESTPASIVF